MIRGDWFFKLGLLAVFCLLATGGNAAKRDYPNKAITYIIPFDPGGQSDLEARRQQPLLEKMLGVPVVITYKTGGGGSVGWTEMARARPDGYTIAGHNLPHIILQPMQRQNAGYRTDDLETVALFQATPIGLAVLKSSPIKHLADFIAYGKAHPGALMLAGSGTYSGHHLAYYQLERLTGTKLTYIPFTGAAPQLVAFLGGHTQAILANSNDLLQHRDKIRILAIGSTQRFAALPEAPTFTELGYKLICSIDRGVCLPKGTPRERMAVLEKAFIQIANNPEIRRQMVEQGFVPLAMGVEECKQYLIGQTREYAALFKELIAP